MIDFRRSALGGFCVAFCLVQQGLADTNVILTTPNSSVATFAMPPSGVLQWQRGAKAGTVPGTSYIVTQVRRAPAGLGGIQTWLEVAPLTGSGQPDSSAAQWLEYSSSEVELRGQESAGTMSVDDVIFEITGVRP